MSKGYYMQFLPKSSTKEHLEFFVRAGGWDGLSGPILDVGVLSISLCAQTIDFEPSGRWLEENVMEAFQQLSLDVKDNEWIFKKWLITLAKRALSEPHETLIKYA